MFSRFLFLIVSVIPVLLTSSQLIADEEVTIKPIKVSDSIYMLTGKGGNIGLFTGEDGSFVIDDQFAPLTPKILAAIKSVGGDSPRFVINTHFHGDHSGGNENMGKTGALIVSHDNVRVRLQNGSFISAFGMKSPPASQLALPVLTFSDNMQFHINNDSVKAIHIPNAHTDGDSFIHFQKANVVHAGDLFFNGFYPFIDAAHGGSVKGVIAGVDSILALTDSKSKIIPGHGPLADRKDLQGYRDMLQTVYNRILVLKNQGVSGEEAIKQKPLKDLESEWGDGMFTGDKWIGVIYPAVN